MKEQEYWRGFREGARAAIVVILMCIAVGLFVHALTRTPETPTPAGQKGAGE